MRTISILFFITFLITNSFSQDKVLLTGKVSIEKANLGGILITVENKNTGTITDATGNFTLQVPVGQQTIMFRVNGMMRYHKASYFNKDNKYNWDVKIGPKYGKNHLIRMKNEGREDELELSTVKEDAYTKVHGTVGFDQMFLPHAKVKVQNSDIAVQTDKEGKFSMWLNDGMQTLEFSFRGFEPFTYKLIVDSSKKYKLTAKFGPAYSAEFLAKKKAEGKSGELKQSECMLEVID